MPTTVAYAELGFPSSVTEPSCDRRQENVTPVPWNAIGVAPGVRHDPADPDGAGYGMLARHAVTKAALELT